MDIAISSAFIPVNSPILHQRVVQFSGVVALLLKVVLNICIKKKKNSLRGKTDAIISVLLTDKPIPVGEGHQVLAEEKVHRVEHDHNILLILKSSNEFSVEYKDYYCRTCC